MDGAPIASSLADLLGADVIGYRIDYTIFFNSIAFDFRISNENLQAPLSPTMIQKAQPSAGFFNTPSQITRPFESSFALRFCS